jgi:hypothetical protein
MISIRLRLGLGLGLGLGLLDHCKEDNDVFVAKVRARARVRD